MNLEHQIKWEPNTKSTTLNNEIEEILDKDTFHYEIDQWEKHFNTTKNDLTKKLKPLKTQEISHIKSKSQSCQNQSRKKIKLPNLVQTSTEKQDFESKYLLNQDDLFKKFKKEIYTDETFRKLIMRYTKFSSNSNENQETDRANEEEKPESMEELKLETQSFFTMKADENSITIIEKAKYFEQIRGKIDKKLQKKIRNSEAFINNKQINAILLRKENSYIIEKMSRIKHLVIFLFS